MGFQSTVSLQQGFGVPGEMFTDAPFRSQSWILNSVSADFNIIGATAYTVVSQGIAQAGSGGANGSYAGILIDPKIQALYGVGASALAPTLTLNNFTQAELCTMGSIVVTLPGAAAIGDTVIFDNTTGALSTITPVTALPGGKSYANAFVDYFTVTGAGLAVITMNPNVNVALV